MKQAHPEFSGTEAAVLQAALRVVDSVVCSLIRSDESGKLPDDLAVAATIRAVTKEVASSVGTLREAISSAGRLSRSVDESDGSRR
mgnify:CR=1 FL=1